MGVARSGGVATWWRMMMGAPGAAPPPGAGTPARVSPPAMTSLPGEQQTCGDKEDIHSAGVTAPASHTTGCPTAGQTAWTGPTR